MWHLSEKQQSKTISAHKLAVASLDISPDGDWLATADYGNRIRLWRLSDLTQKKTLEASAAVSAVLFLDSTSLIAGIGFKDFGKKSERFSRLERIHITKESSERLASYDDWVFSLSLARQSRRLAVGRESGGVDVFDTQSMSRVASFTHDEGFLTCVAISPDGSLVASPGFVRYTDSNVPIKQRDLRDYRVPIELWHVESETMFRTLKSHRTSVLGIAFSPDGKLIASASWDRTVRLWSVDTGVLRRTLAHPEKVWCVAFSPNGEALATGSSDGKVRLWSVPNKHAP